MTRAGRTIYLMVPNEDFRWSLRRAALERRTSLQSLLVEVVSNWMVANGYLEPEGVTEGSNDCDA